MKKQKVYIELLDDKIVNVLLNEPINKDADRMIITKVIADLYRRKYELVEGEISYGRKKKKNNKTNK